MEIVLPAKRLKHWIQQKNKQIIDYNYSTSDDKIKDKTLTTEQRRHYATRKRQKTKMEIKSITYKETKQIYLYLRTPYNLSLRRGEEKEHSTNKTLRDESRTKRNEKDARRFAIIYFTTTLTSTHTYTRPKFQKTFIHSQLICCMRQQLE